jgi:chromosome segregation ATPase
MPLFGGRRAMLEVQNQALIKTARERAERIAELERELQSAAAQIGQLQRELQTAQGRTDIERDLQQARNEVERLTLERDFYSKRASALEQGEPRTDRVRYQILRTRPERGA